MPSITFPAASSGVVFFSNLFDALAGGTAWTPSDSMVGAGNQHESAGNHGNAIEMIPDDSPGPFDLSTLGSITGTILSAIIHFSHNGTYSTVGPGTDYSASFLGETHDQSEGASWSSSSDYDISAAFVPGPAGIDLMENLPTYPWTRPAWIGGSIQNGVHLGYQITALSIEFTYTGVAPLAITPDTGFTSGGLEVEITGGNGNFSAGDTRVFFGLYFGQFVEADNVNVINGSDLTCDTPPFGMAGVVNVLIQTTGFDDEGIIEGFTYVTPSTNPGDPGSFTVSPNHGPVIGGTVVTLTANGFTFGASPRVFFDDSEATSVSGGGTDTLTCTTPAHINGAVNVTVFDS